MKSGTRYIYVVCKKRLYRQNTSNKKVYVIKISFIFFSFPPSSLFRQRTGISICIIYIQRYRVERYGTRIYRDNIYTHEAYRYHQQPLAPSPHTHSQSLSSRCSELNIYIQIYITKRIGFVVGPLIWL